jgi:hypothetical protein
MRTTLPRLRPVSAASAVGRRDVVQVDGGLGDRLVVAGVGELDQVGEVLGAVGAGGRGDRVAGAAKHRRWPMLLVRPAVRIEALCLPSHLDLRPVGFDDERHHRATSALSTDEP